jgi:hypothetical protein
LSISPILYAGAASQAAPPIAALWHRGRLAPARRWIVAWAFVVLGQDGMDLWYSLHGKDNLRLGDIFGPIELATVLLALAWWHPAGSRRAALRTVIPLFAVVWVLLIVFVEAGDSFNMLAGPLKSLVLLGASVWTLLLALRVEEGSLMRQDWFWITIGLALKYACETAIEPLSRMLVQEHSDLVLSALKAKSVADVAASLLIAGGILCQPPPLRASSGPTSSASSPSPSSLPHSAPPS